MFLRNDVYKNEEKVWVFNSTAYSGTLSYGYNFNLESSSEKSRLYPREIFLANNFVISLVHYY